MIRQSGVTRCRDAERGEVIRVVVIKSPEPPVARAGLKPKDDHRRVDDRRREVHERQSLDVAPSLLAWAGVPIPPTMQGRSLLGPLPAREAYGETDHTVDGTRKLFLRGGAAHWKAILSLSPDGTETRKEEWYDLASDPGERESIVPLPAVADPIRRRARERWRGDRGGGVAARPVCLSPEQQERLSRAMLENIQHFNQSGDETMVVPSEYLEVVATTR